jgi:hypothetical protein
MAGAFLPPDHVTDQTMPRDLTVPQPPPYGEMTPPPTDPRYAPPTIPPGPPGPSYGQPTGDKKRGRLVPIAAAVAVAAVVVGGGAVWAATRSGGGDQGNEGVTTSERGPGADNGSAGAGGAAGSANGPAKPKQPGKGKQQGLGQGHDPANPKKKQGGKQPGGSPTKGTGGGGSSPQEPPNKYTPQQACGSGYRVQRSVSGSGGIAYLLYSNSTKKNCAVTMKTKNVGKASAVSVWLQARGGSRTADSGSYAWYAGPVYVSAPGVCVRFGGNGATAPYGNCG